MPITGRVSIRDVAHAAGVSRTSVSLVLNDGPIRISDEKRQAIIDAARNLGYRPHIGARRLASQKLETISLVFPDDPQALSQLFYFEITKNIANAAQKRRYDLLIDFFHLEKNASYRIEPGRADGAILVMDHTSSEGAILRALETAHYPFMVIGANYLRQRPNHYVDFDLAGGTYAVTRHLIELGHQRIAFLAGVPSEDKYTGYRKALREAHLRLHPKYVIECGLASDPIRRALDRLLKLPLPPTAIVATNDTLALALIRLLHDRGVRVPEDISVTGFDDIETAALTIPSLTTARIRMQDVAEQAVEGLLSLIDDPTSPPTHLLLPTELITRESSAPPAR